MCEVVRSNFEEKFHLVEAAIKNADFIAFDAEFTGLTTTDSDHYSLFDTPEIRYNKLRRSVSSFTVSQIGLSTFTKDASSTFNNFLAETFNFYLYPATFGPLDTRFIIQASCGQFLTRYNFDFNKFFYDGIPYLNEEQLMLVNQYLENPQNFHTFRVDFERELLQCCSLVADWLSTAEERDVKENSLLIEIPTGVADFMLFLELKNRFPQIRVALVDRKISVSKPDERNHVKLSETNKTKELNRIRDQVLGFTRVFHLLVKYRKPLVGHNMLMDLLFLHEKFYKSLPKKFSQFKADIHQLFPIIIDTKHLSVSVKPIFEQRRLFDNTALKELYTSLNSLHDNLVMLYPPTVKHASGFERYELAECPHEAGYDAFMCGSALLQMAHLLASNGLRSEDIRPLLFREYLAVLRPYHNQINLIRGATDSVNLQGDDPKSRRPVQWLFVEVLNSHKSRAPASSLLASVLAQFGNVDIQMLGRQTAIVAAGNPKCAKDILTSLKGSKILRASKYNILRHNPWCRKGMWVGVAACGSICLWLMWSAVRQ